MRGVFRGLTVVLFASPLHAQVVKPAGPETGATPETSPPKKPEGKKPDATKKPAASPDTKSGDDEPETTDDTAGEKSDEPETSTKSGTSSELRGEEQPLPPPPPPRADEQEPRPYDQTPSPIRGVRHVEFGPDMGVWSRPAKNDSASYAAAFAYGAHARVELLPVLGFSAYANNSHHSVTMADAAVDQPPLQVFQIGARLEPTWPVLPTLRIWLGLGVAWGRAAADAPSVDGLQDSSMSDRSGVFLEYSAALGGTYDVIPNWLALSLSVSGGVMANQSGDLFDDTQAIDNNGGMSRLQALPEMESSFSALLGVGMIL